MDNIPLSALYQVKGRFHRSVHLERDFYTKERVLDGYILTVHRAGNIIACHFDA